MNTLRKTAAMTCAALCMALFTSVSAHSGRLDSNGGHHKRADGTYHYHLGSDRTIEYSSKPSSSAGAPAASYSGYKEAVPTVREGIYGTSLKTYIKGKQIPTYYYNGGNGCEVIVTEDLENYGYDINWVSEWNTLYVTRNDEKAVSGISIPYTYSGQFIAPVFASDTVVRLTFAGGESYAPPCHSLDGRMIIPVDEMKCLGSFRYSAEENAVYID